MLNQVDFRMSFVLEINWICQIAQEDNETVGFSTQFKVFMTDKQTNKVQQENRVLHFWFYDPKQSEYSDDTNEFMRVLFKPDEFPRG
jgi:hypothetical protein